MLRSIGILSNVSEATFGCACVLIPFAPLFLFVLCVILFICLLSIRNSYKYYIYIMSQKKTPTFYFLITLSKLTDFNNFAC